MRPKATNGTTNNALDSRRWTRRRPVDLPLLAHVLAVDEACDMAQAMRREQGTHLTIGQGSERFSA